MVESADSDVAFLHFCFDDEVKQKTCHEFVIWWSETPLSKTTADGRKLKPASRRKCLENVFDFLNNFKQECNFVSRLLANICEILSTVSNH